MRPSLALLAALAALVGALPAGAQPPTEAGPAPGAPAVAGLAAGRLLPDASDPALPPAAAEQVAIRGRVNVAKLCLALAATGVLGWGAWLRRAGRPEARRRLRDGLLATLGVAACFGWWNFFHFHHPAFLHANNVFVYYVGSKYFAELGYTRLYECTALADAQAGLRARVARRLLTDLGTYELVPARRILADPARCTRHFTPARWALFQGDVRWFRSRLPAETWEEMQRDHGYNPTPVWGLLGTPLASLAPASTAQILLLTLLDPLLDLLLWACVGWAFGWRALCVALVYWGTNHFAEFSWTGGSYLRDDWLAATLVGLCLLRRSRPLAAGFLLGWATLLRVFPALAFFGVALAAAPPLIRHRVMSEARLRLALGGALAAVLLVPASTLVAGGFGAWSDFARNTRLHVGTPGSNLLGLRTALSYHPEGRLSVLLSRSADPSHAWKEKRRETFAARRPLFYALAAAYLALLAWAVRGQPDWAAAVLGLGALPILLEPTCYYTSVLAAFGLLWTRRESVGVALCGLSALSWLVAARFTEWDDVFVASSVPVVAFVVFATLAMGRAPREPGTAEAARPVGGAAA
jgi:hypothetical protein